MNNILTVGAYGRDNFGDILFFIITRNYLKKYNPTPATRTAADMRNYIQDVTLPYTLLMQHQDWDIVWVVGGEVGGVTSVDANRMLMSNRFEKVYLSLDLKMREKIDDIFNYQPNTKTVAYIPTPRRHSVRTKYVLNSVGLASLNNVPVDVRRATNAVLKKYDYIYVRDNESKLYCDKYNIPSKLSPDLVHAIKLINRGNKKLLGMPAKYFVIQFKALSSLNKTVDYMAGIVDEIIGKLDMDVIFLAAGTANHHDSLRDYEKVREVMKNKHRSKILYDRNPMLLVDCIAQSSLAIGTSLHVRIVAIAYAVPRVSLEGSKLTAYASFWDAEQPYNVAYEDLPNVVTKAMETSKVILTEKSQKLSIQADMAIRNIMKDLAL